LAEGDPVTRAAFEEATWSAVDARCATSTEPWRRPLTGGQAGAAFAQHRTTWEPPAGPRSSRCLNPGGWTLLFAGARFDRPAPRAPSVLEPKRVPARSRACVSARRRLATSWMLTLRAPSFHVGAGRAFTRCVPISDASCRHSAPARRLLLPTSSFGLVCCSRAHGVRFTERPESFHRPLAKRSHLLCREKMEERLEAPSVVPESSVCLRRSARRFSHAHPTPRGAGQSHSSCLPCYVRA